MSDAWPTNALQLPQDAGVMIVDHGSRRRESNELLLQVVELFRQQSGVERVLPAHMELAEPSILQAFDRLVAEGARWIVVHPYFLAPGRHWHQDIPALVATAAAGHPSVPYLVTAPLGLHRLMAQIMAERIDFCWRHAMGQQEECSVCQGSDQCRFRGGENTLG